MVVVVIKQLKYKEVKNRSSPSLLTFFCFFFYTLKKGTKYKRSVSCSLCWIIASSFSEQKTYSKEMNEIVTRGLCKPSRSIQRFQELLQERSPDKHTGTPKVELYFCVGGPGLNTHHQVTTYLLQ
jgi:hypothetical protein